LRADGLRWNGQRSIIKEKIAQLAIPDCRREAQVKALNAQFNSVQEEMKSITPLGSGGLSRCGHAILQLSDPPLPGGGQSADAIATYAMRGKPLPSSNSRWHKLDNDRWANHEDFRDSPGKAAEVLHTSLMRG